MAKITGIGGVFFKSKGDPAAGFRWPKGGIRFGVVGGGTMGAGIAIAALAAAAGVVATVVSLPHTLPHKLCNAPQRSP